MEEALNIFGLGSLTTLGIMSFITIILVEDLKQIFSKKVPTQVLTLIVAICVAILLPIINGTCTLTSVATSVIDGFIVSFISMNGFDSLKNIWKRLNESEDSDFNE